MLTKQIRAGLGFLSGILALLVLSCSNDIGEIKAFEEPEVRPVLKVEGLEVLYSDSARLQIKVTADSLLRFTNNGQPYMEFPKGIRVYFYDSSEKPESSLSADYARFNEKDDRWEARGNVVIVNREGEVITTPEVTWDRRKARLFSDKEVRIRKKEEILYGVGFDADERFNRYTIHRFSGVISVSTEAGPGQTSQP